MMSLDFNTADKQMSFDPIPANTIVSLCMSIRPGGVGDGGWFTQSSSSDAVMLSCEFTVTEGQYAKRKVFQYFVMDGGKRNEKGESIGGNISRATMRAILESARNIQPEDMSDAAVAKRRISNWGDFNGICFLAKLGIEKGQNGYADKNKIMTVILPGMKEYAPITQVVMTPSPSTTTTAPSQVPSWASSPASPAGSPAGSPTSPVPSWAR